MNNVSQQAIFLTGTDTNVGKTVVSALLCQAFDAGYWKPIQSGITDGSDSDTVRLLTQLPTQHFYPESYALTEPLSPHAAAAIDKVQIELEHIVLPNFQQPLLIVEGAGGVMVPLNSKALVIDLIQHLNIPTIVVARSGLGTINHTLLTLQALRSAHIDVLGVIMNGPENLSNASAIENYGNTVVLSQVDWLETISTSSITTASRKIQNELRHRLPHLASIHANEDRRTASFSKAGPWIIPRA